MDMSEKLLQLFPMDRRIFWQQTAEAEAEVQEIRMRACQPVIVIKRGIEWYLDENGHFIKEREKAYSAKREEMEALLQHICNYSVYAFSDEIKQGFITVAGGHRVGIAGQVVLEKDETVRTIKHIAYMNIRVSHQIIGAADRVLSYIYEKGVPVNVLIISPPGCGKTTLLRDLIRQISDGNAFGRGCCVGVVDERSEIAGSYLGRAQNDVGMRTDVLDACPKVQGMQLLLRSMSPQVIAIDELGGEEDGQALHLAASCGSRIIATVHGEDLWDMAGKATMKKIFWEKIFDCFIVLERQSGKCQIKHVYGKDEAYAAMAWRNNDYGRLSGSGSLVQRAVCGTVAHSAHTGWNAGAVDE